MPRALALLVLVATTACGPVPRPIAPVSAPPRVEAVVVKPSPQPPVTYHVIPGLVPGEGMPVAVPDTTRLERMPVLRPDTTVDPLMATRWYGSTFRIRIRGPAGVKPSPDSTLRIAPRP